MHPIRSHFMVLIVAICVLAFLISGRPAAAQQASITLANSDVALCNGDNTTWNLVKAGSYAPGSDLDHPERGTVTWTVTATKVAVSHKILTVNGFVRIQNTGTANATIGNIVVNLQKQVIVAKNQLGHCVQRYRGCDQWRCRHKRQYLRGRQIRRTGNLHGDRRLQHAGVHRRAS